MTPKKKEEDRRLSSPKAKVPPALQNGEGLGEQRLTAACSGGGRPTPHHVGARGFTSLLSRRGT